jgi:ribose transport system substrate-binding protein
MKPITWFLAAGIAILVAGCGKEQAAAPPAQPLGAHSTTATPSAPTVSQPELDAVRRSDKPVRIALVVKTKNNPFFDPMIKAAETEARALGAELEVQAPPQESDKELQFTMVQNEAAKGVQAILIAPADSRAIVPALKAAADKGILVINIDNRVDRPSAQAAGLKLAGYVGADNEAGGKLAGEAMAALLGPGGKVAILEGIRGADNAEARRKGFEEAVQGKLTVVAKDTAEWDTQKAYAKFQAMLAAHPEIQGLFCANDKMALGAIKAIQEAGKKGRIQVFGYDNIADIKPYLQTGEMCGTIEQHPDLMGKYGVRMAVGILTGKVQPGKEFLVPLEVIKK